MREFLLGAGLFCALGLAACVDTTAPSVAIGPAHFTGQYVNLKDVDHAPFPLSRNPPQFPWHEKSAGIEGNVVVAFLVDVHGRPTQIQIEKASNPAFAAATVDAVSHWRFDPAMKNGQPVVCTLVMPIDFKIGAIDRGYPPSLPVEIGAVHFTGDYFQLNTVDKKPVPISQPQPIYPMALRQAHVTGKAVIVYLVDTDGRPTQVQAESATHPDFAAAAVAAVSRWRFIPALKDGKPVVCQTTTPIVFSIRDSGSTSPSFPNQPPVSRW